MHSSYAIAISNPGHKTPGPDTTCPHIYASHVANVQHQAEQQHPRRNTVTNQLLLCEDAGCASALPDTVTSRVLVPITPLCKPPRQTPRPLGCSDAPSN